MESRDFAEVDEVVGEERIVVSKGDSRDFYVHGTDAEACDPQTSVEMEARRMRRLSPSAPPRSSSVM
jgi:hypothetical protein